MSPAPSARDRPDGRLDHVTVFREHRVRRVVRVCVELNPGVPERHVDPFVSKDRQRVHVGLPAGDDIHLSGHERPHVATHHGNLDAVLGNAVLGEERPQQDPGGSLRRDLFPDKVSGLANRCPLQGEIRERMLLIACCDALDRDARRPCKHQGGAGGNRSEVVGAGCNGRDPVDVRAAGHDFKLEPFLSEIAQPVGRHLAENAVRCKPAKLQLDLVGTGRTPGRHRDECPGARQSTQRSQPAQHTSAFNHVLRIRHREIPSFRWSLPGDH